TTMPQLIQLSLFFAAVAVLVATGCILTRKSIKHSQAASSEKQKNTRPAPPGYRPKAFFQSPQKGTPFHGANFFKKPHQPGQYRFHATRRVPKQRLWPRIIPATHVSLAVLGQRFDLICQRLI